MKFGKIFRPALLTAAALLVAATSAWALSLNDLPTRRVNGVEVYYYDVQPGESIYTIAQKLGISVADLKANNPSVTDGVKPHMRLFFPTDLKSNAADAPAAKGDSAGPVSHVVKKGESIYGIARQYGMTMDELLKLNPQAADGIKPGERLRLSGAALPGAAQAAKDSGDPADEVLGSEGMVADAGSAAPAAPSVDLPAQGAAVDASSDDNSEKPKVRRRKKRPAADDPMAKADSIAASAVSYYDGPTSIVAAVDSVAEDSVPAEPAAEIRTPIQVAVILPFLLEEETMGRQTQLITEFYKGFLLAADSLNRDDEWPVNIRVFDSCASTDSVREIMRNPIFDSVDLIIAPDNPAQLEAISMIAPSNTLILNVFAVRDTTYMTRPGMIQPNIPREAMYQHAVNGFVDDLNGYTPVFITRTDGKKDKEEFTSMLRQRLDDEAISYKTIDYDGYLSDSDLEGIDPDITPVVFIPASGNRDEFDHFVHAIKSLKERALLASNVRVFGYPEWATFRGDSFDQICDLESTIYSRYFPTERDADAVALGHKFQEAYGEQLLDKQMPVLGILGFDSGRFVIDGLRERAATGEFPLNFAGIQSELKLKQVDGAGYYNDALYFIDYLPGGGIRKSIR